MPSLQERIENRFRGLRGVVRRFGRDVRMMQSQLEDQAYETLRRYWRRLHGRPVRACRRSLHEIRVPALSR